MSRSWDEKESSYLLQITQMILEEKEEEGMNSKEMEIGG